MSAARRCAAAELLGAVLREVTENYQGKRGSAASQRSMSAGFGKLGRNRCPLSTCLETAEALQVRGWIVLADAKVFSRRWQQRSPSRKDRRKWRSRYA